MSENTHTKLEGQDSVVKQRLEYSLALRRVLSYVGAGAYALASLAEEAIEAIDTIGNDNIQLLTAHKEKFEMLGAIGIGGALVSSICIGLYGMKMEQ